MGRGDRTGSGHPDRRTAKALAEAVAGVGTAAGPGALLAFVDALLPFSSSLVTVFARHGPPVLLYDDIPPERREVVVGSYLKGAYLLDPFYEHVLEGRGNRVIRLRDIEPDHFRRTEFYRNYYADTRLADEIGISVERTDGSHVFVSIGLDHGDGSFSRRGRDRLDSFLPVVAALLLRHWDRPPSGDEAVSPGRAGLNRTLDETLKRDEFHCLTEREREIVALMLKGHSSKSIARDLDIAVGTVKNHRKNVYRKLSITSQPLLFARFLRLIA